MLSMNIEISSEVADTKLGITKIIEAWKKGGQTKLRREFIEKLELAKDVLYEIEFEEKTGGEICDGK